MFSEIFRIELCGLRFDTSANETDAVPPTTTQRLATGQQVGELGWPDDRQSLASVFSNSTSPADSVVGSWATWSCRLCL